MRDNKDERRRKKIKERYNKARFLDRNPDEAERTELKRRKRKWIREVKELKLDYDLVKKFKKRKEKIKSTKEQLKQLKRERKVVPYSLKKNYVQEQSNTEMISAYNSVKRVPSIVRQTVSPSVPKPKDVDYKRGYVKRYFVQRANDNRAPISEVSSTKFSQIATNAFYKQVKLRWRINGPLEDYEDAEGNVKKGVYTSNKRSIEEQLRKMPSLKNRLVNLGEYHISRK